LEVFKDKKSNYKKKKKNQIKNESSTPGLTKAQALDSEIAKNLKYYILTKG